MSMGVEEGRFIGVPVSEGIERPPTEAQFKFRYLNDDRVEVYHPFHGTVRFGDQSTIDMMAADTAAAVLFRTMPYLIDSMKLNRPRAYETRKYGGEYPQLSHLGSLGILAQEFGGGPLDIFDGLFNDASHTHNGHQGDDNYQGHGQEDLHDKDRADFFKRAGILDALEEAGALTRNKDGLFISKTRLSIDRLLDEDEVVIRRSFLSNKHPSRRLDVDRFQYSEEERLLMGCAVNHEMPDPWRVPSALSKKSFDAIARKIILIDDEGDQLVFTEPEAALESSMDYVEHNSEHWCEPVQDLVNDLLNLAERYFFVCDHPYARNMQYFYPRDYLHTSASLMFEHYQIVAKDDPAMAWLLGTAEQIARDQSEKSIHYSRSGLQSYVGPNPPGNVTLVKTDVDQIEPNPHVEGYSFIISLPQGKMRTINPRVMNGGGETKPLSELYPDFEEFCSQRHRWIGNYQAEVRIDNPEDVEHIVRALQQIEQEWPRALRKISMPPSELQRTIKEANDYVLKHGLIVKNA